MMTIVPMVCYFGTKRPAHASLTGQFAVVTLHNSLSIGALYPGKKSPIGIIRGGCRSEKDDSRRNRILVAGYAIRRDWDTVERQSANTTVEIAHRNVTDSPRIGGDYLDNRFIGGRQPGGTGRLPFSQNDRLDHGGGTAALIASHNSQRHIRATERLPAIDTALQNCPQLRSGQRRDL